MTKKELNVAILAGLTELNATPEQLAFVDGLTKPKIGGGSSNVNDYTVYDEDGTVTHIFCVYHKKWEPVVNEDGEELVKPNDKIKNGYTRECIEASTAWKEQTRTYKATKDGIMLDLLEGEVSPEDSKKLLATAETARAVHTDRSDGLGTDDKPEGFQLEQD